MSTQSFTDSGYDYFEVTSDNTQVDAVPEQCGINLGEHAPSGFWSSVDTAGDDIHVTNSAGTTEYALRLVNWSKAGQTGWVLFDGQGLSTGSDVTFRVYVANGAAARPSSDEAYTSPEIFGLDSDCESDTAADESQANQTVSESGTVGTRTGLIGNGLDLDADYLQYTPHKTPTDVAEIVDASASGEANTGLAFNSALDSGAGGWYVGKYDDTAANGEILVYDLDFSTLLDSHTVGFSPQGVALDDNGLVWVADPANEKLWAFDPSNSWNADYEITLPAGFAGNGVFYRSNNDRIYVFEIGNATMRLYNPDTGAFDTTWDASGVGSTVYNSWDHATVWSTYDALVIAVDAGTLYVVDFNAAISGAMKLSGISYIEGVAFSADNELYLCNDAEYHGAVADGNRVWKIAESALAHMALGLFDFSYRVAVSCDAATGVDAVMVQGNPISGNGWGCYFNSSTTTFRTVVRDGSNVVFPDRTITSGTRLMHVTIDRVNDEMKIYENGSQNGATVSISSVTGRIGGGNSDVLRLGNGLAGDSSRPFDGMIDCAQYRLGVMTANEISTEAAWMTDNANFWTVGTSTFPSSVLALDEGMLVGGLQSLSGGLE